VVPDVRGGIPEAARAWRWAASVSPVPTGVSTVDHGAAGRHASPPFVISPFRANRVELLHTGR